MFLKQVLEMKNPNRAESIRVVGNDQCLNTSSSASPQCSELSDSFVSGPSANFEGIEKSAMLRHAAPILGEHTRSVLQAELGYTDVQLDRLLADKIIQ